jgi:DNA-binding beta-propeller fold protein YncE
LDYLFYDGLHSRVWVPAGGTGSVAVFDVAAQAFTRVSGFKTAEREAHGKVRSLGPSAGAVGDNFAYIGNRASAEVCVVDLQSLKTTSCLTLQSAIDGVEYVAQKREVWVTAPRAQALVVLDASKPGSLRQLSKISLPGVPEGYAVDHQRRRFLTNLEDLGTTLAIDLESHRVQDTWHPGCSSDGPRGLALDSSRGFALVACTDHVQVLDMAHGGKLLGRLDAGEGVDNIDFNAQTGLVYVAAGKAARLTVARLGDHGELSVVRTAETAPGARNAVADASGNVYVADPLRGRLLLFRAAAP